MKPCKIVQISDKILFLLLYVEISGRALNTIYSNFLLDKTQDIVYNGSTQKNTGNA